MLTVAFLCDVRRHQLAMGKDYVRPAMPARKMILPCAYGLFGGVCEMDVWGSVVDASVFRDDKGFDVL